MGEAAWSFIGVCAGSLLSIIGAYLTNLDARKREMAAWKREDAKSERASNEARASQHEEAILDALSNMIRQNSNMSAYDTSAIPEDDRREETYKILHDFNNAVSRIIFFFPELLNNQRFMHELSSISPSSYNTSYITHIAIETYKRYAEIIDNENRSNIVRLQINIDPDYLKSKFIEGVMVKPVYHVDIDIDGLSHTQRTYLARYASINVIASNKDDYIPLMIPDITAPDSKMKLWLSSSHPSDGSLEHVLKQWETDFSVARH